MNLSDGHVLAHSSKPSAKPSATTFEFRTLSADDVSQRADGWGGSQAEAA